MRCESCNENSVVRTRNVVARRPLLTCITLACGHAVHYETPEGTGRTRMLSCTCGPPEPETQARHPHVVLTVAKR